MPHIARLPTFHADEELTRHTTDTDVRMSNKLEVHLIVTRPPVGCHTTKSLWPSNRETKMTLLGPNGSELLAFTKANSSIN